MVPNINNWCGGAYGDWLEVMLTDKCNGSCSWCIEHSGYRPIDHAPVDNMIEAILGHDAENVILLGGEPTLYPDMDDLIIGIVPDKNVYVTTNGSNLNKEYIFKNFTHESDGDIFSDFDAISGLNISIHNHDLIKNEEIIGISIDQEELEQTVCECRAWDIELRLNCNIIAGHIDTWNNMVDYLNWAKERGISNVRFAELKGDKELFVSLAKITDKSFGLNENPYIDGCSQKAEIRGMNVSFRQMCGLQTECREKPTNPKNVKPKKVLYYDGKFYDGWQTAGSVEIDTKEKENKKLKEEVKSLNSQIKEIKTASNKSEGWGCQY